MDIVPPSEKQFDELCDICAKVFSRPSYFDFLASCRQSYIRGSCYDWAASRVAVEGGRIVGHVGVWTYRLRVGAARLKTGGLGAVLTHPDFRKQGLAGRLMGAVQDALRAAGHQYSLLFGIPDFYHKFGFAAAWPETRHVVELAALPQEPLQFPVRRRPLVEALCRPGDILDIYNRENATRTGTAERPLYFRRLVGGWRAQFQCHALVRNRRAVGYLIAYASPDALEVSEVGGVDSPGVGVGQLLAAAGVLARRAGRSRIRFGQISYAHPLCQYLRGLNCQVEMSHRRSAGAMAAVVNLPSSLAALAGVLSARLAGSAQAGFAGRLTIAGAGETALLGLSRGRVRLLPARAEARTPHRILAGAAAARLLIGSATPGELAAQSGVRYAGRGRALAEALFPAQWPMMNALDGF